ncbi:uncharacterized protein PG986_004468 [Apiospora aurea]|uniref:Uncharacterized protein n=1 Tax=Apiospora aurea TaxID=335848 RepID=A0ABR1QMP3_9PEZI
MEGITASHRLEDVALLARQRPETEEATWRLLGALSFMSPIHPIPYSVFQPASSSSLSSPPASPTHSKKDASGVKARARRELNDRKMLQDPLPWVVISSTDDSSEPFSNNHNQQNTETGTLITNNSRARSSGSVLVQNLFEEALQPLLETAIVRRSHVRGPLIHLDAATQHLYRAQTVKRHGQRDFDLAVRMLLQVTPTPSSLISFSPSSPTGSGDTIQTQLAHHVLALTCHFEKYAANWPHGDDGKDSSSTATATAENKKEREKGAMDRMFVQPPRFAQTKELEQLTKRTLELSGYREA